MKTKISNALAVAGSGIVSYGIVYLVCKFIYEQIGCDCGEPTFSRTLDSYNYNTCGCADQAAFSTLAEKLVIIIPILVMILTAVFLFAKARRQNSSKK